MQSPPAMSLSQSWRVSSVLSGSNLLAARMKMVLTVQYKDGALVLTRVISFGSDKPACIYQKICKDCKYMTASLKAHQEERSKFLIKCKDYQYFTNSLPQRLVAMCHSWLVKPRVSSNWFNSTSPMYLKLWRAFSHLVCGLCKPDCSEDAFEVRTTIFQVEVALARHCKLYKIQVC